jgi:Tfp pilus assembly protein PilO
MTFSPRQYRITANLVAVLAVVIATALQSFTASGRFADTHQTLETQRARQQTLLGQTDALTLRRDELTADGLRVTQELQQVRRRIPASAAEADFLEELSEHAEDCGVTIEDFIPGEVEAMGEHMRTQVRITATTDFGGFCRFLRQLRTLERLCDVDEVVMTSVDPAVNEQSLELTLSIFHAATVHVAESNTRIVE